MHDGIEGPRRERPLQRSGIPDPALDEGHLGGDRHAVAAAQIVEHHDLGARRHELVHHHAADVPGAAGDEDPPRHSWRSKWKSLRSASTRR